MNPYPFFSNSRTPCTRNNLGLERNVSVNNFSLCFFPYFLPLPTASPFQLRHSESRIHEGQFRHMHRDHARGRQREFGKCKYGLFDRTISFACDLEMISFGNSMIWKLCRGCVNCHAVDLTFFVANFRVLCANLLLVRMMQFLQYRALVCCARLWILRELDRVERFWNLGLVMEFFFSVCATCVDDFKAFFQVLSNWYDFYRNCRKILFHFARKFSFGIIYVKNHYEVNYFKIYKYINKLLLTCFHYL